jgi:hypothetical protein
MHVSRSPFAAVLFAALTAFASPSLAGSVCGTVRDATTLAPVPQAAIFLFDNTNTYTGLYAGTDVNGHYCVNNVPDGTYTLQVKVNDYITATITGVEVTTTTGVDVDLHPRFGLAQPWPNPASSTVNFRLAAAPDSQVDLNVYDVAGRRVYGWRGRVSAAESAPSNGIFATSTALKFNRESISSGCTARTAPWFDALYACAELQRYRRNPQ